jgi:hypothetical protein
MPSSGMLRRVALVKTDVSEELSVSFIRVTRIGELGITLAVASNRRTHLRHIRYSSYDFFFKNLSPGSLFPCSQAVATDFCPGKNFQIIFHINK